MKNKIIYTLLIFAAVLLFNACSNSLQNNPSVVFPDTGVSFTSHVEPFLKQTCALEGCHSYNYASAGVLLEGYSNIIMSYNGALVIPYKPNNSLLVNMLEYKTNHEPLMTWSANDNQKKGIRQWITEGAKNN